MLMKEEVLFQAPPISLPGGVVKFSVRHTNLKAAGPNLNNNSSNNSNNIKKNSSQTVSPQTNANLFKNSEMLVTKSGACVKYVCSRVTLYHSSRVELKWRRSLHYCHTCDFGDGSTKGDNNMCGAIHYGRCTPVVGPISGHGTTSKMVGKLPTVNPSPSLPKGSSPNISVNSTSSPSSHHLTLYRQTITNGSIAKDKANSSQDIRGKDQEKENTNTTNYNNNNLTQTIDNESISSKESRSKKKDNSKQTSTVIQNANLPKFHFPYGRPSDRDDVEEVLLRVSQEFSKCEGGKATNQHMGAIAKAAGYPLYWKCPLFCAAGGMKQGYITYQMFSTMFKRIQQSCHDRASQFVTLLAKQGTNYVEDGDLVPLIQDVVDTHPGLTFLLEAPEFHSRYVNTVIARIFYCVNRSWTGRITIQEFRKSNFLNILALLEDEDDINQVVDFFSYEHFYVIYCKFWELDKDHDLYIDRTDLARHNEHAISTKMIERIFSGAVTRGKTFQEGKMSYPEFVWFLLAEEDKKHPTSVEYWFRCMDIDGDGMISMYEMEYFYEEQMQKMEALGIERLPFEDCLCQMLDLVQPEQPFKITLMDLKRCKMTNIFFDTFMNLDKFLEHEQRDPFANLKDLDADVPEPTDWEKFAAEEYELLVAEEGANEAEEIHYEDDFEPDDDDGLHDDALKGTESRPSDPIQRSTLGGAVAGSVHTLDDDIYDFSQTNTTY